MYVIKMNKDKSLSTTVFTPIHVGEQNIDTLSFILPRRYENHDIAEYSAIIGYTLPGKNEDRMDITPYIKTYNGDYYVYAFPVGSPFTDAAGYVGINITVEDSDKNVILKTTSCYLRIFETDENIDDSSVPGGAGSNDGIYILKEGESVLNVPTTISLVIDPYNGIIYIRMSDGTLKKLVIDANAAKGAVRYDENQELSDEQKDMACGNIGTARIEFTEDDVNVVTFSGTATVGQAIVVEEVDDNGIPVKWGAEDFPESEADSKLNPIDKTPEMTAEVGADDQGRLFTAGTRKGVKSFGLGEVLHPDPSRPSGSAIVMSMEDDTSKSLMLSDLANALEEYLPTSEGASVEVDTTLTQSGKAADAKTVGDELSQISEAIENMPRADWNQNDENSGNYIAGRTHYWNFELIETAATGGFNQLFKKNPSSYAPFCIEINGVKYCNLTDYAGDGDSSLWADGGGMGFYIVKSGSYYNIHIDENRYGPWRSAVINLYQQAVGKELDGNFLPVPDFNKRGGVIASHEDNLDDYEYCVVDENGEIYARKYNAAKIFSELSVDNLNTQTNYQGEHGLYTDGISDEISEIMPLSLPVHAWFIRLDYSSFPYKRFFLLEAADGAKYELNLSLSSNQISIEEVASTGGSGGSMAITAEVTGTDDAGNPTIVVDTTYAEISAALTSGVIPVLVMPDGSVCQLFRGNDSEFVFVQNVAGGDEYEIVASSMAIIITHEDEVFFEWSEGYAPTLQALEEEVFPFIMPKPEIAEVGQMLRVSEVDENGKVIAVEAIDMPTGGGSSFEVEIDDTLSQSGKAADAKVVGEKFVEVTEAIADLQKGGSLVEPVDDDIPRVYVWGNTLPTTKTDTDFQFRYISKTEDFEGYAVIKCQGASSMNYAKKNFTVKLYADEAHETKMKKDMRGWGKQNKFVLKANWIDHSHARNIINARLWAEVIKSRSNYDTLPEEYKASPNLSAIDGFPIKLYANGTYQGIYTWNIPKDAWMTNMDEDNPNHILFCCSDNDNDRVADYPFNFRALWNGKHEQGGWDIEVGSESAATTATLNNLISHVKDTDDATFKAGLDAYLDVQSAIDYLLFIWAMQGVDSAENNMLLMTYDGVKLYCGGYDMDATWGISGAGAMLNSYTYDFPADYMGDRSLLWERMLKLYIPEIKARWAELRETVLNPQNIDTKFEEFWYHIGTELLDEDVSIWTNVPSKSTNNIKQIRDFVRDRLNYVDGKIDALAVAVPCMGITLDKTAITINGVGTQTLTATVTPEDTTEIVLWTTSDDSVAVVSGGVVTSVANGNATITATCGSYSATCAMTVTGISQTIACTGINLDHDALTFTEETTQTLTATVTPTDCTQPVTWKSEDDGIATVLNGVITPVANGTTTITATCGDYSATCEVTVQAFESLYPFEAAKVNTYSKRDDATGVIGTDGSGWYATTDPITLPVGCYRSSGGQAYCKLYIWDAQGNYCGYFHLGNGTHTIWIDDSMDGYKFALQDAKNGIANNYEAFLINTFTKVDNSATATEGQTISLKDLTWTEGGANAVYAKVADAIVGCSDPSSNIASLNMFGLTLNALVSGLPHYLTFITYNNEWIMYYYGLGNVPATAVQYFTENDIKLIVNGGAQ